MIAFTYGIKYVLFLIKVYTFFRHNAIECLIDYIQCIYSFYMQWETKIHVISFVEIFVFMVHC